MLHRARGVQIPGNPEFEYQVWPGVSNICIFICDFSIRILLLFSLQRQYFSCGSEIFRTRVHTCIMLHLKDVNPDYVMYSSKAAGIPELISLTASLSIT